MIRCPRRFDPLHAFAAVAFVLTAGAATMPACAQAKTGHLTGQVVDEGRAPVAGATVTINSFASMGQRQTVTNANGRFWVLGLAPGHYQITVCGPVSECPGLQFMVEVHEDGILDLVQLGVPNVEWFGTSDIPSSDQSPPRDPPPGTFTSCWTPLPELPHGTFRMYPSSPPSVPIRSAPESGRSWRDILALLPGHRRAMSPATNANCPLGRQPV